jgi:hypothetical protein
MARESGLNQGGQLFQFALEGVAQHFPGRLFDRGVDQRHLLSSLRVREVAAASGLEHRFPRNLKASHG